MVILPKQLPNVNVYMYNKIPLHVLLGQNEIHSDTEDENIY
jgi:hypothetical protein